MTGVAIARELALLGAETVVATPKERFAFDDRGPGALHERWTALGSTMRAHGIEHGLLDGLDYWLLMLCAAAERYPEAANALGLIMDAPGAHLPTPMAFAQLMHAATGVPQEEALRGAMQGGRAARLGLIEVADTAQGKPWSHQTLRLSAAQSVALLGERALTPVAHADYTPAFDEDLLRAVARLLEANRIVVLRGTSGRSMRQFASDMAGWLNLHPVWAVGGEGALPMADLVRDGLPVLDLTGTSVSSRLNGVLAEAATLVRGLLVLTTGGIPDSELPTIAVPPLGVREALRIWTAATRDGALAKTLAARFRVSSSEAAAACRYAAQLGGQPEKRIAEFVLQDGGRRMGRMVTHLQSQASFDDLVVPGYLRAQLVDIIDWHRHSARVFGEMEMGRLTPLGRGLTCLFSGPPGTGKTFAAQCLANELGLNLYRIDLSQVVSKYIGETEKALGTVFDEAEAGHGLLLFDECDALFGKRSEVKDAHDRYANIEVGYLLQRLEAYEGIAILATNLRSNMDPAFVRRIRFLLDFPMPDLPMRRDLWERSLPSRKFREDSLDLTAFADRFRISGGSIQNITLAAAHMAAATPDGRITTGHLVRATFRELEKSGQSRERSSFGELAAHLPEEVA